ncbi:MAG: hypothetical protein AAGA08_20020 [Pseudomonadota bacterium]
MSDYTTNDEGLGGKALVVAAVLIGMFILALAFMGTSDAPNLPAGLADPAATEGAAPAVDPNALPATE